MWWAAAVVALWWLMSQGAKVAVAYLRGEPVEVELAPVGNGQFLRRDAAASLLALLAAAERDGVRLWPVSGFRTMAEQEELRRAYLAGEGNLAARPGWSLHQAGVSVDLGGVGSFESAAFRWLARNAEKFGFTNDVASEWWHWTYTAKG